MKKLICLLLVVVMLVSVLAACGESFTCDLCEEEKSGKKHTETLFGEELTICDDCKEELDALADLLG